MVVCSAGRCYVSMWTCADRGNFHKMFSDIIARRRANLTAATNDVQNVVDAVFALNIPDDAMISDLATFFVVGYFTVSSRESAAVLLMRCCDSLLYK